MFLLEFGDHLVSEYSYGLHHNVPGDRRRPVDLEHDLVGAVLFPEHLDLVDHIFRGPEQVNLFGTAEEVVDKIHVLREQYSADEIMFEVNWTSSVPRDVVTKSIQILSDKVIPEFK